MDVVAINKFKESVLNILKLNPNGVYQNLFFKEIPDIKTDQLLVVINELNKSAEIETADHKNKGVFFRLKGADISKLENKISEEEKNANKFIRDAGSNGISNQLLRRRLNNKTNADILKIEKRLVDVGLIKVYYFNNQKVYVAIDIVPDNSLSEKLYVMKDKNSCEEKIAELQSHILDILKAKYNVAVERHKRIIDQHREAATSVKGVMASIQRSYDDKISIEEIKLILDSLAYAKQAVKLNGASVIKNEIEESSSEFVYRYKPKQTKKAANITTVPCILCPHKEYCTPGKEISPENCVYMDSFLEFF